MSVAERRRLRRVVTLMLTSLALAGCSGANLAEPSLSDAQRVWCGAHDMTPIAAVANFSSFEDDAVLSVATDLDHDPGARCRSLRKFPNDQPRHGQRYR